MEDANLDRTAGAIVWGGFANCGQVCASVERVIVHKSVLPRLLERLVPKVQQLVPGDTTASDEIQIGPLNNERQRNIVRAQVEDAVQKGAKVLIGGESIDGPGYFYKPTILVDVTPDMNIMNAETFGPVVTITTLDDEQSMITEANRSHLGLLAYVFCKDAKRGRTIAEQIEAGTVMVNDVLSTHGMPETPWGGVKNSGLNHTHGDNSLRGMCEQRHVNYDRLPWMKNEIYWYPYGPRLYNLLARAMRFLFSDSLRGRLKTFRKG
jgi:succinate-semialdehyde dehydrogenase/glutarate-semialdehyde dehydrogenase